MISALGKTFGFVLLMSLASSSVAAGDASAGQAASQPCAACHGADGNSVAPNYPGLAGQNERYLLRQLRAIKSGARPAPLMAGQLDALSDQTLQDLAAFFATKAARVAQSPEDVDLPSGQKLIGLGQRIYRGGLLDKQVAACSACHSPVGQGNDPAGFPSLRGQSVDYVVQQLTAYREQQRKTDEDYGGMMRQVAARMTDEEIRAVASYIQGLTGEM